MVLAVAFDEVKTNQGRSDGDAGGGAAGGPLSTNFFGPGDNPDLLHSSDLPHASLNQPDPGHISGTHFHLVDQFQVIVDGKGKLGRHDLTPYCVHFSRAYTPYGPLISDTADPLKYFVMHAHTHPDWGSRYLPQAQEQLKQVRDRRPWQITCPISFPELQSCTSVAEIVLSAIPGMQDERGLAGYTLSMKPNCGARAPDPSPGEGQYLVVLKGGLLLDNKEYKALALVFVRPNEGPVQIHAGLQGLEALVLNFPRPLTCATDAHVTSGFKTWLCIPCGYVYDEATGVPEEGIAAGTRWDDVPDTWTCPDCDVPKADFVLMEPQN